MTENRAKLTINRQVLLGELAADAESRALPTGDPLVNLRVTTYSEIRDRASGELREIAEQHRVAVFGKPAEDLRGLKKGEIVYVEGRTRTRKYQPQGATEAKYFTEISVTAFEGKCFVVSGTASSAAGTSAHAASSRAPVAAPSRATATAPAGTDPFDDNDPPY